MSSSCCDPIYVQSGTHEKFLQTLEQFYFFIKDVTKASKKTQITIERELYTINTFEFSEDEIYFTVGEKVGTINKKQLKTIEKL